MHNGGSEIDDGTGIAGADNARGETCRRSVRGRRVDEILLFDNLHDSLLTTSAMDAVVPPEITAELTQILSNLVLGDNDIRAK